MIYYVFISGQPDRVGGSFAKICASIQEESTFGGGQLKAHLASTREWAVAAYSAPDPLSDKRILFGKHGALAINGPVLSFGGRPHRSAAHDVLEHLRTGSIEAVYEELSGTYSLGGFTQKHGLFGFSDFSGVYPTYSYEENGLVAVSNRASVLAELRSAKSMDLNSLSWLQGHANIFGSATPFLGVDLIEPGNRVCCPPGGRLERREFPSVFPGVDDQLRDTLTHDEWDEITHELVGNMQVATSCMDRTRIGLTGGKDSRLCLALALRAGVADKLGIFTTGAKDSPEIECAVAVADAAGLRHPVLDAAPAIGGHTVPTSELWVRLRAHPRRYENLVCPWDGQAQNISGVQVELSGFGGEIYRGPGGHAKQFRRRVPMDVAEAVEMWRNYHQPMDVLNALRPRRREYQVDWLASWVQSAARSNRLDALPEKFFVNYRLAHWNGPMAQGVTGRIKLLPLLSRKAASMYLRLKPSVRATELLHYEVMRRTAAELTRVPFLNQNWAPSLLDQDADLPRCAFKSSLPATNKTLFPWQFSFVEQESEAIIHVLRRASRETDIESVIDVQKVCSSIRSGVEQGVEVKAILSALGVAHSLLGEAGPVADRPSA